MDRSDWDRMVSVAGAVVAVVLIALGAMAIYGGNFGQQNVRDRLEPQNIVFPPTDAMTPEEKAAVGEFAGQKVDTGVEAEAFSRYIGGHLEAVNDGATYSETSAAARQEGLDPQVAAELQAKADTLFKGESLRAMLLNAYGWWTVATIALWAGITMVIAGLVLGVLAILGFRHASKVSPVTEEERVLIPERRRRNSTRASGPSSGPLTEGARRAGELLLVRDPEPQRGGTRRPPLEMPRCSTLGVLDVGHPAARPGRSFQHATSHPHPRCRAARRRHGVHGRRFISVERCRGLGSHQPRGIAHRSNSQSCRR